MDIYASDSLRTNRESITWGMLFPWLSELEVPEAVKLAQQDITEREDDVDTMVKLISSTGMGRSYGDLFPTISDSLALARLKTPNRIIHALQDADQYSFADIQSKSVHQVALQRGISTTSALVITKALVIYALNSAKEFFPTQAATLTSTIYTDEQPSESQVDVAAHFEQIALWFASIGALDVPLLSDEALTKASSEVMPLIKELRLVTAGAYLPESKQKSPVTEMFSSLYNDLLVREQTILSLRTLQVKGLTLSELGKVFGVTRERIRQLENATKKSIYDAIAARPLVQAMLDAFNEKARELRPLDDVLKSFPTLGEEVPELKLPLWRIFERLSDAYKIEDGWILPSGKSESVNRTTKWLEEKSDDYGVLNVADFNLVHVDNSDSEHANRSWLDYCGVVTLDDKILSKFGSAGDRAASILSINGGGMSPQEIADEIKRSSSKKSNSEKLVRSASQLSDLIIRVDMDKYALADSGLKPYLGIVPEMTAYLEEREGEVELTKMIEGPTPGK